ncbi:MAG: hypothetical protein JO288_18115 [Hyphomicrobiales bacterium]|nr:hypothetical protein [Hyphomicrobiales bacterium]
MPPDKSMAGGCQPPDDSLPTIAPPSPSLLYDPEHWRSRAEEARTIAEQMMDRDAIATMLKVAEQYEEMAQKAERRRLAKNQSGS